MGLVRMAARTAVVAGTEYTGFEGAVPFTIINGADSNGLGGNNDRPDLNPNGRAGVRAVPVVNAATGAITGYINPDDNNAPIDPNTARPALLARMSMRP